MMLKQTKIVASISDQRCEVEFIRDLFKAGMNVVRMNTAHASREGFEKLITNVREVSNRIAILMDTKGPEVRTTAIAGGEPIPYQIGDKVKIVGNPAQETTRECIAVSYPGFVHDLQVDGDILIDVGDLERESVEFVVIDGDLGQNLDSGGEPLAGFGFEVSCDAGVGRAPDHGARLGQRNAVVAPLFDQFEVAVA